MTRRQGMGATHRRRQRGEETAEHKGQDRSPGDRRQTSSPAVVEPLLRAVQDDVNASALRPLVARQLMALQATHGNQYVQRLVSDLARSRPREANRKGKPVSGISKSGPASIQRKKGGSLLLGDKLRLDPDIKAKMKAMEASIKKLEPGKTKAGLLSLPLDLPPAPYLAPLRPEELAGKKPLVKPGAGPKKPRAATGGDLLKGIVKTGVFDRPLAKLREKAERDFRKLKPGEKALLITTSAVIGGGLLAGVISDPKARGFALDQLDGLNPDIPGVPGLSVKFKTAGGKLGAMLMFKTTF